MLKHGVVKPLVTRPVVGLPSMETKMNAEDIALICAQMGLTGGVEAEFATAFYARMFEIAPQLRAMFPHDLSEQGAKLMQVLVFAVNALDRPEVLAPAVQLLGVRHASYGVKMEHFDPVGEALLHTLATALGAGFDAQARAAWTAAFVALAGMMAEGMATALRPAA